MKNLEATTNPGLRDDSAAGYEVGSVWVNTLTGITFTATDVTVGAAVWSGNGGGGSNIIWATVVQLAGVGNLHAQDNNYGISTLGSSVGDGVAYWAFNIPSDFGTLTRAVITCYLSNTGSVRIYTQTSYDGIGVARGTTNDYIAVFNKAMTSLEFDEIDISGALSGLAAGDYVGVRLARYGSHVDDTGGTFYILGIVIEYTT